MKEVFFKYYSYFQSMRIFIFILTLFLFQSETAKSQDLESGFLEQYFDTSEKDSLSFEDSVVVILNAVRMHPQTVAEDYKQSWFYDKKNPNDRSLYKALIEMSSIDSALRWDTGLADQARCHAVSSGHASHIGHDRVSDCPEGYDAECINYGLKSALKVVIELLEDHGVPDLGHRKILLSSEYLRIGVAQAFHRTYRYCTVIDMGRQ